MIKRLLEGQRLRLTAMTKDDAPTIVRWHDDNEFVRLLHGQTAAPQSEESVKSWLESAGKAENEYLFAIRLREDDRLIGLLHLDGILWNQQVCGIAIGIGEPGDRGRGFGTEAMSLGLDFAFDELNMRRVNLTVFGYNEPAIALYERLGFQQEGTFREFLHRDGKLFDMLLYGILRREWNAQSNQ